MMDELKPCPFCGGKARVIKESDPDLIQYKIMCQNCGISTPFIGSREQSEDTWNRRVALESDNTEVLDAYQELLQKSMNLNGALLKKLKMMNEGENNPLTLGQLRQMIGQPVWVEPIKSNPAYITPCWHGIERVNDDRIVFSDCIFWLSGLNKTYHAYTRKPEGSEKA